MATDKQSGHDATGRLLPAAAAPDLGGAEPGAQSDVADQGSNEPCVMRGFYSGVIDEFRTSKQNSKLHALLADGRTDKTNPKAGTKAYTTTKTGEKEAQDAPVRGPRGRDARDWTRRAHQHQHGVRARGGHCKKLRLSNISRRSAPKAAQSSGRSRMARNNGRAAGF